MSFETERIAIFSYLKDNWDEVTYGRIKWPNQIFVEPSSDHWNALFIISGDCVQASLNNIQARMRQFGILQLDLLDPEDEGISKNLLAQERFKNLFLGKILSTSDSEKIVFQTPSFQNLGQQSGWIRRVARCPFYRDYYETLPS